MLTTDFKLILTVNNICHDSDIFLPPCEVPSTGGFEKEVKIFSFSSVQIYNLNKDYLISL